MLIHMAYHFVCFNSLVFLFLDLLLMMPLASERTPSARPYDDLIFSRMLWTTAIIILIRPFAVDFFPFVCLLHIAFYFLIINYTCFAIMWHTEKCGVINLNIYQNGNSDCANCQYCKNKKQKSGIRKLQYFICLLYAYIVHIEFVNKRDFD